MNSAPVDATDALDQEQDARPSGRLLIVDDEEQMLIAQKRMLTREGYEVFTASTGPEALEMMRESSPPIDVTLCDLRMEGMDGMQLIETAKALYPDLELIMMTGYGTIETAVEAIRKGAYDFLTKPFKRLQLLKIIARAMEHRALVFENRRLRQQVAQGESKSMIGRGVAMRQVRELVSQVAPSEATILILGESGTGKEVVARSIHESSDRARGPFVKVSCAALPETLLEAELFGYERGAFTGADRRKPGRFELAKGGTLFLDEIGDIPLEMQVKLLRVLQEREFDRLGGTSPIKADVRVLTATHRDLQQMVRKGQFREDLYYRLAVIPVEVPPLRDRREDIPLLAAHFCSKFARDKAPDLEAEALELLMAWDWPGNVRELENAIERAVVLSPNGRIGPAQLPPHILPETGEREQGYLRVPLGTPMREVEDMLIGQAMEISGDDKQKAATLLGISSRTVARHLDPERRRDP